MRLLKPHTPMQGASAERAQREWHELLEPASGLQPPFPPPALPIPTSHLPRFSLQASSTTHLLNMLAVRAPLSSTRASGVAVSRPGRTQSRATRVVRVLATGEPEKPVEGAAEPSVVRPHSSVAPKVSTFEGKPHVPHKRVGECS